MSKLTDDPNQRLLVLVEHSRPRQDRPRLSPERESRLSDIEARSAACYASIEDLSYKIRRLVEDIKCGPQRKKV